MMRVMVMLKGCAKKGRECDTHQSVLLLVDDRAQMGHDLIDRVEYGIVLYCIC